MFTRKIRTIGLSIALLAPWAAQADFADGFIGGVVGGVTGSVITNEIYRHQHRTRVHRVRHRTTRHTVRKKRPVRRPVAAPILTPEKKIQIALKSLGFYHGAIDGEVNAYETRSAIREMNRRYERGNSATLDPEARDTLVYLGDLLRLDRYLSAQGRDTRTKNKRLQAALKIHGTYHGKIDGAVGPATRRAIAEYTGGTSHLDFETEYRLIEDAHRKNDRMINEAVATLKRQPLRKEAGTPATTGDKPVVLQPTN